MAHSKIQNLLQKIQSIIGDEQSMSRLEKDLVKDYLREVYELTNAIPLSGAIKSEGDVSVQSRNHFQENIPSTRIQEEPSKNVYHATPVRPLEKEISRTQDSYIPNGKKEQYAPESSVEVKERPQEQSLPTAPLTQPAPSGSRPESTETSVPEVFRQEVPVPKKYESLFESTAAKELSDKLSRSPISDLNRAFSINDRLLIVGDLFANDQQKFQETIDILNTKYSFDEAKSYLMRYIVDRFNWIDEEKSERAREFIKLVERRYLTL